MAPNLAKHQWLGLEPLAYHLSGGLVQFMQGDEYSRLADHGVGGFPHFIAQIPETEYYQEPVLYVLPRIYCRAIVPHLYRTSFLSGILCIQDLTNGDKTVHRSELFETEIDYLFASDDREGVAADFNQTLASQPGYRACNVVFPHTCNRGWHKFSMAATDAGYIVDRAGKFDKAQAEEISRMMTGTFNQNGSSHEGPQYALEVGQ